MDPRITGARSVYVCPFPGLGGTQEYTFLLARKMLAHGPTVLAMPFDQRQETRFRGAFEAIGGETLALPTALCDDLVARGYPRRLRAGRALARLLRDRVPLAPGERLVLHTSLSPVAVYLPARMAAKHGIAVNTFHDFGQLSARSVSYPLNTLLLRLLPRRRTGFVVPSAEVREQLVRLVAGIGRERVRVIHTGIDPLPVIAPARPKDPPIFFMVGRVAEAKAPAVWLAAAARYLAGGGAGRFLWVGGGPLLETMQAEVERRGLGGAVSFTGHADAVEPAVRDADVFVLSSLWEGGCLPRSVLEAMFRGFPCILPRQPSILEALRGEDCVVLYRPGDADSLANAFAAAAADPDAMAARALRSRDLVMRHHTANAEFAGTAALYLALFASAGRDRAR